MATADKLFSVIIAAYNNAHLLYGAIDSVLMQDYPAVDLIVVDDGSADFPQEDICRYIAENAKANLQHFEVYQNPENLGTVRSINGALRRSSGAFIKLIAADDALYDAATLRHAAEVLEQHPDSIVMGVVTRCDSALRPQGEWHKGLMEKMHTLSPRERFRRLCVHNDIIAGSVFFHRSFFEHYGYFDESYRLLEDWPTWLRAAREGIDFYYAPFHAIRYRTNAGVGTGTNAYYLQDKRRVLEEIIIPARRELGVWYLLARLSFGFVNSSLVRKLYGLVFRR